MGRKRKWHIEKPRSTKLHPMPYGLQVWSLKRLFNKLNPKGDFDDIDLDYIDPTAQFFENVKVIKEAHPRYRWVIPREKKKAPIKDRIHWKRRCVKSMNMDIYTLRVPIQWHTVKKKCKSKNELSTWTWKKRYGRIQVIVDEKWIGEEATIIVRIPCQ